MLPETVLEELTRDTPLRRELIEAAWPDLSTESRLQVLQVVGGQEVYAVGEWLTDLALNDEAAVVRYWGVKYADIRPPIGPADEEEWEPLTSPEEEDKRRVRYERVADDPSPFVRACVTRVECSDPAGLAGLSQRERLVIIRTAKHLHLNEFFSCVGCAVDLKVPDDELADCVREFMTRPDVQEELGNEGPGLRDGGDAQQAGKGMRLGWELTKTAGPRLACYLAQVLPTSVGLSIMEPEELAKLPDGVIEKLIDRAPHRSTPEIDALLGRIDNNPQNFSVDIRKAWTKHGSYKGNHDTPEELAQHRALNATDRQRELLKEVLELKQQLAALSEQLVEVQRKRGSVG